MAWLEQALRPKPLEQVNQQSRLKTMFLAGCGISLLGVKPLHATEGSDGITAVASTVSQDYVRVKLPDGSFKPETYSFGNGGCMGGSISDKSIDKLSFEDVARAIAAPLLRQNYIAVNAAHPESAALLIMVYWGTTQVPGSLDESPANINLEAARARASAGAVEAAIQQLIEQGRMNDEINARNASLLGYNSWWDATDTARGGTPMAIRKADMLNELEEERYFVILMTYDLQLLSKSRKPKLLWETRFSIRQRHHEFDKDLPATAQYASQYFGQDSHGLVRKEFPLGHVEIGEVKSLGVLPDK